MAQVFPDITATPLFIEADTGKDTGSVILRRQFYFLRPIFYFRRTKFVNRLKMASSSDKKLVRSRSGLRFVTLNETSKSPFVVDEPAWVTDDQVNEL